MRRLQLSNQYNSINVGKKLIKLIRRYNVLALSNDRITEDHRVAKWLVGKERWLWLCICGKKGRGLQNFVKHYHSFEQQINPNVRNKL